MTLTEYAKKHGFEYVEKTGQTWNGYEVYIPWNERYVGAYIGLPHYILKKGNKVRMCEPDECLEILDCVYPNTDNDEFDEE